MATLLLIDVILGCINPRNFTTQPITLNKVFGRRGTHLSVIGHHPGVGAPSAPKFSYDTAASAFYRCVRSEMISGQALFAFDR